MKYLHYALVLGAICVAAALSLAGVYRATSPRIEEKQKKATAAARKIAVPVAEKFEDVGDKGVVKAVAADGAVVGYAALGEGRGYSSTIKMMVGVDAKKERIVGLKVVYQAETPGLGTRIAEVKTNKSLVRLFSGEKIEDATGKMPWFIKDFIGCKPGDVRLKKDGGEVQGISGATVSSRAAVAAVRNALEKIKNAPE